MLLDVAPLFRLDASRAARVLSDVVEATGRWAAVARSHGLPAAAIDDMAPAFDHAQRRDAARAAA